MAYEEDEIEPDCECVRIDVDLNDNRYCLLHGPNSEMAIPLGADLEKVLDRFFLALLSDPQQGVMLSAHDLVRSQIQAVIELYTRSTPLFYGWIVRGDLTYSAAVDNHFLWQAELLLSLLQTTIPERTVAA